MPHLYPSFVVQEYQNHEPLLIQQQRVLELLEFKRRLDVVK